MSSKTQVIVTKSPGHMQESSVTSVTFSIGGGGDFIHVPDRKRYRDIWGQYPETHIRAMVARTLQEREGRFAVTGVRPVKNPRKY